MAQCVGNDRAKDAGIEPHDGSGDAGHAGREDDEQLARADLHEIGTDQ